MMATIALISCTKKKKQCRSRAELLYDSPLYRKSLLYALERSDKLYILSAKFGLLHPDDVIDPYDLTISSFNREQKISWGTMVGAKLQELVTRKDQVYVLCGKDYYEPIRSYLHTIGCRVFFPVQEKSLGYKLRLLKALNDEGGLTDAVDKFYRIMKDLYVGQAGGRVVAECNGRMEWPNRGVYFLIEPTELLTSKKYRPLEHRIVRVGTHAVSQGSKTSLWNRLSTHRGGTNGAGNHRSSIFRLHVGSALMARRPALRVDTWAAGQVVPPGAQVKELDLEREVSRYIGEMRLLWLDVLDAPSPYSDRAYLERNAIGLLSRYTIAHGLKSSSWLGSYSPNTHIAASGLWNLNHLYLRPDTQFLDILAEYVSSTLGRTPSPIAAIAPSSWYNKRQSDSAQLSLVFDDPSGASAKQE